MYKPYKQRHSYGRIDTAYNGVFLYLQNFKWFKEGRDANQMASFMGEILRDYLAEKELPTKLNKSIYNIDINCKTVQKDFQSFRLWVEDKYCNSQKNKS